MLEFLIKSFQRIQVYDIIRISDSCNVTCPAWYYYILKKELIKLLIDFDIKKKDKKKYIYVTYLAFSIYIK